MPFFKVEREGSTPSYGSSTAIFLFFTKRRGGMGEGEDSCFLVACLRWSCLEDFWVNHF